LNDRLMKIQMQSKFFNMNHTVFFHFHLSSSFTFPSEHRIHRVSLRNVFYFLSSHCLKFVPKQVSCALKKRKCLAKCVPVPASISDTLVLYATLG